MHLSFDAEQAETLREVVTDVLKQTRIESARTDGHDFRAMLHRRELVLESVLAKLVNGHLS
jgi:hypothetical protein